MQGVWMPTRLIIVFLLFFSAPASSVEVGDIPPDYLGKSDSGQEIRLSESAGRIRIVTFWASWCAPCLKELPVLNAIQKKGGADRIQVIAVNLKESPKRYRKAMKALQDYEIEFVHDRRGTAARKYDVEGIPHMLIIDVDGRIAYQHIGYKVEAIPVIVGEINQLLIDSNLAVQQ
jgi:thiol-disulfide isomerase/thioredoxin